MEVGGLRYLVLGPVEARDERGTTLDIGGAQRRAVLAQLTLASGRVVSVDALITGLWDDRPPPTAVKSIQVHVSRLRAVLPAGDVATRSPGYLLDVGRDDTDLGRFEALTETARSHRDAGRGPDAVRAFRSALSLWRGTPLSDVATHPFAASAVPLLEEARTQVVEECLALELELGRHGAVVGELEALVRGHPLRERLWGLLMVALYRCERQADALEAFARCRRILVEELGLEPGAELRRLEQQVLAHELPPPTDRAAVPPTTPGTDRAGTATSTPYAPPVAGLRAPVHLVGRERELDALAAALDRSTTRGCQLAVVRGEEGLGKSAAIATFARAISQRARVVAGRCREHVAVPYGPWVQVMEQVGARREVATMTDAGPGTEGPERRRIRIFEGVAAQLRAQAFDRPLVVVLDDLHWTDQVTVDLLLHLLDDLAGSPILFIAAWRDRSLGADHPTRALVDQGRTESIDLDPLDVADVIDLLELTALETGHRHRAEAAAQIHEVTAGIPLFTAEVLTTLAVEHRYLPAVGELQLRVPESVVDLVSRRVESSGPHASQVAEACAILAEPLIPQVVAAMVGNLAPAALVRALDALATAGLVVETRDGYAFVHDAFRHSVLATMSPLERRERHAHAHELLSGLEVPPNVLAHHAAAAGGLVPDAIVAEHHRSAALDALQRGAFADAAAATAKAIELVDPYDLATVHAEHADALGRMGDLTAMKHAARSSLELARLHGSDGKVIARAISMLLVFGDGFTIDRTGLEAATEAARLVQDPVDQARIAAILAYHHALWGSPVPVAERALATARDLLPADPPPDLDGGFAFAEALALLGDPDLGRRFAAIDTMEAAGRRDPFNQQRHRVLRMRCLANLSAGRLPNVRADVDELLEVADREGSWLYRADAHRWQISLAIAAGDLDAAGSIVEDLRSAGHAMNGRAFVETAQMLLQWFAGDHDACLTALDAMWAVMPVGDPCATDRRLVELIRLTNMVEAGQLDRARAEYDAIEPHRTLDRSSCRRYVAELALTAGLAADLGLTDLTADLTARLEPFHGQLMVLSWGDCLLGSADGYLAALDALHTGRPHDAAFQRAIALEERLGDVTGAARTRRRWMRMQATDAAAIP